ncbi:DnaB-like helicase C-terminal domain-containing protein [Streptomyces sp. GD-15H]|uniref:DnaB-like helicase C-terminal domain-containing protein n=1 Tax=Streptomyces sp. GD-15H TaxID=3129112 RepID=UPI00324EC8F6
MAGRFRRQSVITRLVNLDERRRHFAGGVRGPRAALPPGRRRPGSRSPATSPRWWCRPDRRSGRGRGEAPGVGEELAADTGAVLIALARLDRGPEQRQDKRPAVSDLRDSDALEQDADAIILLHREDYYEPESGRAGETDLIVAKHRNGPTATVTVAHQFHYSRLRDMGAAEEPAL